MRTSQTSGCHQPGLGTVCIKAERVALGDAAWATIGQVSVTYRWSPRITGLAVWSSNITASPQPRDNDWTNVDVQ